MKAVVRAEFNDPDGILSAIVKSDATRIWFATDFFSIPWLQPTRAAEAKLGCAVDDAIKRASSTW